MKKTKGISLIVLIITIIVMLILAGAIIISITNTDIFNKANDAQRAANMEALNSALSVEYSQYLIDKNLGQDPVDEGQTIAMYLREQLIAKGVTIPEAVVIRDNGTAVDFEVAAASVQGDVAYDEDGNQVSLLNWNGVTWIATLGGFQSGTYSGAIVDGQIDGKIPVYVKKGGKAGYIKSLERAFFGKTELTTIPLIDTSRVTNMWNMFYGCENLTTIPLIDTSRVTIMWNMFFGCNSLTTIPLIDTSNVIGMTSMFQNCTSLTTIPLIDTSNVINMSNMFLNCASLTTIPQLDTSNVTNMECLFYWCINLTTIPQLNTSNVTNMRVMFGNCNSLTTIPQLDTSNVTNMNMIFYNCNNLTALPNDFVVSESVTDIANMFRGCRKLIGSVEFRGNIPSDANTYANAFTNAGINGTGFTVKYTDAFTNIEAVKSASTGTNKITWTLLP